MVAFDRDDEGGEVAVADDLAETGVRLRACRRRSSAAPSRRDDQRLTLRWVRRTISIIDSHGLVDSSVRFRLPLTPSRVSVSVSSIPSRSEPAAPGCERSSSPASG